MSGFTQYAFANIPVGTQVFLIAACAGALALYELPAKFGKYALLPVSIVK